MQRLQPICWRSAAPADRWRGCYGLTATDRSMLRKISCQRSSHQLRRFQSSDKNLLCFARLQPRDGRHQSLLYLVDRNEIRSGIHHLHQKRPMQCTLRMMSSSGTNDDKDDDESSNRKTTNGSEGVRSTPGIKIKYQPPPNRTDPAFANYLMGKVTPKDEKTMLTRRKATKRRTSRLFFGDERELLRKIQQNQVRRKEVSRQKTATNGNATISIFTTCVYSKQFDWYILFLFFCSTVHRALLGNILICGGMFVVSCAR